MTAARLLAAERGACDEIADERKVRRRTPFPELRDRRCEPIPVAQQANRRPHQRPNRCIGPGRSHTLSIGCARVHMRFLVHHAHVLTLAGFARQHANYGRGLFRVRQLIASRTGAAMRVSPASFYFSLVPRAFRYGRGVRRFVYTGLEVLSQLATLSGASYEAILVGGAAPSDPAPLPAPPGKTPT